jgi:hypothetical protein
MATHSSILQLGGFLAMAGVVGMALNIRRRVMRSA